MTPEDARNLFEECKANLERLLSCDMHDFRPVGKDGPDRRYRCLCCGGEIRHLEFLWYQRGFTHGQSLANKSK